HDQNLHSFPTRRSSDLIPAVLRRGCEGFTTLKDIQRHLESLYGAQFSVGVQKKGERQILRFSMEVVNDEYVAEQGLLAQSLYFLDRKSTRLNSSHVKIS